MKTNEQVISEIEADCAKYPKSKSSKKFMKYANWLRKPVFPVSVKVDHFDYFREDMKTWNRIIADLICEDIDYSMDYKKDVFIVSFKSFNEMNKYHQILCNHFPSLKECEEQLSFHDHMFGSGITDELISEEGE